MTRKIFFPRKLFSINCSLGHVGYSFNKSADIFSIKNRTVFCSRFNNDKKISFTEERFTSKSSRRHVKCNFDISAEKLLTKSRRFLAQHPNVAEKKKIFRKNCFCPKLFLRTPKMLFWQLSLNIATKRKKHFCSSFDIDKIFIFSRERRLKSKFSVDT